MRYKLAFETNAVGTLEIAPGAIQDIRMEELEVPQRIATHEDKKTGAKTFALPFQLPDGNNGVVMVCRLKSGDWIPSKDIQKIVIHLKK